ncbi:MAG: ROK family protein [Actinomycetota bacterium]
MRGEPLTRTQIGRLAKRSAAAVSGAVDLLEHVGLVEVERAALPSSGGRPADRLAIRGDGLEILGLLISPMEHKGFATRLLRADLRGDVVEGSERTWTASDIAEALERLPEVIAESAHRERARTLVGVAIPGVVTQDALGQGSLAMLGPEVDEPAQIARGLAREGWQSSVLNSEDAAAVGSLLSPQCTAASVLYVYWGFGLGSGFAERSDRGYPRTRSGGEVGHMPISLDPSTLGGKACYCGSTGCLTMHVDVIATLQELGFGPSSLEEALDLADTDPSANRQLTSMTRLLGAALAGVVNLMAPDQVVLGGPIFARKPELIELLAEAVQDRVLAPHSGVGLTADGDATRSSIVGMIDHARHRYLSSITRGHLDHLEGSVP